MTPNLATLIQDPQRAQELPQEAVIPLLVQCAALQSVLAARVVSESVGKASRPKTAKEDRLLRTREAADMLGETLDYIYRHADEYPFTVRDGSRQVRFSFMGIQKFIKQRRGR